MSSFFFDLLTAAEEKRAQELSRRNAEENQRRIERGLMTPEEAALQQAKFDGRQADIGKPSQNPSDPFAVPNYDNWGPDFYWGLTDWQRWYDSLEAKFGRREAALRWNEAWSQQGLFSAPLEGRLDPEFRAWADSRGLDLYYGAGVIAEPIGAGAEVLSGVSKGVTNVGRAGSFLVPLALVAVAVFFLGPIFLKTK